MIGLTDAVSSFLFNPDIPVETKGHFINGILGVNDNLPKEIGYLVVALKPENDQLNERIAEKKSRNDKLNKIKCRRQYLKRSCPTMAKEEIDRIIAEEDKKGRFEEKDSHQFTPIHTDSHQLTPIHTNSPHIPSIPYHPYHTIHNNTASTGHTGHKGPDRDLHDVDSAPLWDDFIGYCLSQMVAGDDEGLFRQAMEELFNRLTASKWKTKDKKPIADWNKFVDRCIRADRDEDKFRQEPSVEVEETYTEMDEESVEDSSDVSNFI